MKVVEAMKIKKGDSVTIKPNFYDYWQGEAIILEVYQEPHQLPEYLVLVNGMEVFFTWQRIEVERKN